MSILRRKYASQPVSPRGKSTMANSRGGLSPPRSLVSVRSMPAVLVEKDWLDGYSLEEYINSLYAPNVIPQKAGELLLLRSPLTIGADSDLKLSGREPVVDTLIPSQKGDSLAIVESDTSSPPIPLMKDYCGSSDESTSSSVSTKSVASEVTVLDFGRTSEAEEDRGSMGAAKCSRGDPGPVTEQGEIESDETLSASRSHLPRASRRLRPFDLGLSLETDIEKDMSDPDPSFHRAVGSPVGPVKEAFIEQVGSAFYIKNLKNDSLGRLPQITPVEQSFSEHESPELIARRESSPGSYRSRGSETISSNSSNRTVRPGERNVVILPGESGRRYHSNCYRRSHGGMGISSAARIGTEGGGNISPHTRHRGVPAPEGPSRPPASPVSPVLPATPATAASPEAAWVRAASEEFSFPSLSILRKEKGSVVLERMPFPPGRGGSSSQGIHPAPPIKTTVLCYANVLPEKSRAPTPVLMVDDASTSQPDSPFDSPKFSSVRGSRVSAASSAPRASGCASGVEGSESLRSVKALLLNEGIQLKEDDARSRNGTPGIGFHVGLDHRII